MAGPATSENPSADEVLDIFQEIILSGAAISAAFNAPLHLAESCSLAPVALRTIRDAGRRGLSQADLSRALGRSAPWTTRLVDHLERDGLILRTAHPSDRRVNMLTLSGLGLEALNGFVEKGRMAVLRLFPNHTTLSLNQFKAQLHQFSSTICAYNHS